MSETNSFHVEVAMEVGLNAAVVFYAIHFWCRRNRANGKNEHGGLWYVYNSVKAWDELFPYLTAKQIRTALDKLESVGFLESGCFNENPFDRTKWYAVSEKGWAITANRLAPEGKSDLPSGASLDCPEGQMNNSYIPVTSTSSSSSKPEMAEKRADDVRAVIAHLNEVCGTGYRPATEAHARLVRARLADGMTVEDLCAVVDVKASQWIRDPRMRAYLRPSTLFSASKAEGYLAEARAAGAATVIGGERFDFDTYAG